MRHFLLTIVILTSLAAPALAQTQYDTSPGAQTGTQIFGSYFAADIDSVSNFNGNLHLSIPLFSLPGRELPYGLSLSYNAQKWEGDSVYGNGYGHYTGGWNKSNVFGVDFSFFNPHIYSPQESISCEVYWIDGAGTKHKYVPDPDATAWCDDFSSNAAGWNNRTLISMDSDGSKLWTGTFQTNGTDPARINFKNGHILYFHTSAVRLNVE